MRERSPDHRILLGIKDHKNEPPTTSTSGENGAPREYEITVSLPLGRASHQHFIKFFSMPPPIVALRSAKDDIFPSVAVRSRPLRQIRSEHEFVVPDD
jgi:hypothetical protein